MGRSLPAVLTGGGCDTDRQGQTHHGQEEGIYDPRAQEEAQDSSPQEGRRRSEEDLPAVLRQMVQTGGRDVLPPARGHPPRPPDQPAQGQINDMNNIRNFSWPRLQRALTDMKFSAL